MTRVKTFDSTGIATSGRLYAGDLNLIQDQYADLTNLAQTVSVGTLKVGETGLQLLRYGAGEARITGLLRTDGIMRGLGGIYAGAFTNAQRNAMPAGFRPYGLVIINTDNNRLEWNKGTDAVPNWTGLDSVAADLVINHIANPTGAHPGTAISYNGVQLAAVNVQAGLEELGAGKLNASVVNGAWTAFTPVIFGSSGNPTYGTGNAQGAYQKIGRTVNWKAAFRWIGGSVGSGFYTLGVPIGVPVDFTLNAGVVSQTIVGYGYIVRSSDSRSDPLVVQVRDTDEFFMSLQGATENNIGSANLPQRIVLAGTYETTT